MLPRQNNTVQVEVVGDCKNDDWKITTTNMYLFAALWAEGGVPQMGEFDRSDPRRIRLVISGKGLKKVVDDWWSGDSPYRRFSEKLRDVKECVRPLEVIRVTTAGSPQQ